LVDAEAAAAKPATTDYKPLTPRYPGTSTGRRAVLANWVASSKNPLTARVAINHIWSRHLGEPLVPTMFDFGLNGKPPTNQKLLDWLAVEFAEARPSPAGAWASSPGLGTPASSPASKEERPVEDGRAPKPGEDARAPQAAAAPWSIRHIHRLIVTSATYRMASGQTSPESAATFAANQKLDPDNKYNWRSNIHRMEAEAVRDSVLAVAGKLDVATGGAELDPAAWQTTTRRSLYYRHANEKQAIFMQVFDAASPNECYRRAETVTPQQSLALANSPLALSSARTVAAELSKQVGPGAEKDEPFVAAAYERLLARPPTSDERSACLEFLTSQAELLKDPKKLTAFGGVEQATVAPSKDPHQRAREDLVHVLLNHNDFVTMR
jgi:hypothetical protein